MFLALSHADDVFKRRVFSARPVAGRDAGDVGLAAAVELIRPLFLGRWPAQGLRHLAVLVVDAVAAFWLALALTRKRFRN